MGQPAAPARLPVTAAQQGGASGPLSRSPPRRPARLPDDRIADDPQAVPPLFHLAPGCIPLSQSTIVFDFMSEAEDRDRIAHRDDRGARDQALPAQPEHEGGQVPEAGHC